MLKQCWLSAKPKKFGYRLLHWQKKPADIMEAAEAFVNAKELHRAVIVRGKEGWSIYTDGKEWNDLI